MNNKKQDQGKLIAVCGIDGAGKSSLIRRLQAELGDQIRTVTKDGKSVLGDFLSFVRLHCDEKVQDWSTGPFARVVASSTALDFLAHYSKTIEPLIADNQIVVCDRYAPCYQAYMRATGSALSDLVIANLVAPAQLYILIDAPLEVAIKRQQQRGGPSPDENPKVLSVIQNEYRRLARENQTQWITIENNGSFDDAFAVFKSSVSLLLPRVIT